MGFADDITKTQSEEAALVDMWQLGDYHDNPCPKCGRHRLCVCANGKHRCEKCNWVPEDNKYCEVL